MNSFYDKYADKGLVIIGDHFPEFAYERDVDNVRQAVKDDKIKYAVAIDNDGATWNAYHQNYWPTMYLIDKRGIIRYEAIGEHDYSRTEEAIKALLAEYVSRIAHSSPLPANRLCEHVVISWQLIDG